MGREKAAASSLHASSLKAELACVRYPLDDAGLEDWRAEGERVGYNLSQYRGFDCLLLVTN